MSRVPLKKTEFLLQIEAILKKYGYDNMYCLSESWNGDREGGKVYSILGESKPEVAKELNMLLDPTWGLEDFDWQEMSGVGFMKDTCGLNGEVDYYGLPIYENGEFYAK